MNRSMMTAAFAITLVAMGCKDKPAQTPADANTSAETDPTTLPGKDPTKAAITVGPKIAELCSLPTSNFAFDSASLSESATAALDALAACFVDGPAKGKNMRLVGHADPRGDEEYNLALGQKRAASVGEYLKGKGLEESRMETSSEGELDATGTDEESWAKDRKVEIFLAE